MRVIFRAAAAFAASIALTFSASLASAAQVPAQLPPLPVPPPNSGGADSPLPPYVPKPISPQRQQEAVTQLRMLLAHSGAAGQWRDARDPNLPNPLDFGKYPQDPDDYMLPQAAKDQFGQNGTLNIGRPMPGGTATGSVPAGLKDFYGQKLKWGSCRPYGQTDDPGVGVKAQCAYMIVPVDYDHPDGQTAAIGLYKIPARKGNTLGTIFLDPGGPGASGMELATWLPAAGGMAPLLDHYDVIGFDPRGVGASLPQIRCRSNADFDVQREGSDGLKGSQLDQLLKHNTDACYHNTGRGYKNFNTEEYLAQIGTRNVVKDLDVARSVVGDKTLNYMGFSYGTSIGYQYAMAFKDNVGRMLLDGVVNPFESNPPLNDKFAKYFPDEASQGDTSQINGFQHTFEQFLAKCRDQGGFDLDGTPIPCALGTKGDSIQTMQSRFQQLARAAYGTTAYHNSLDDRVVSFADVILGTVQALYSDRYWPRLNASLALLKKSKDGAGIQTLADDYYERDENGHYTLGDAAFNTISCVDDHQKYGDRQAAAEANLAGYEAAPFTDPGKDKEGHQRGVEPAYGWCHYYRHRADLPAGKVVANAPNILVMSTTYDSATPYPNGVVAADALRGTLLTVAGATHTSYGRVPCATEITNDFFLSGKVPPDKSEFGAPARTKTLDSKVVEGKQCRINSFRTSHTEVAPEDEVGLATAQPSAQPSQSDKGEGGSASAEPSTQPSQSDKGEGGSASAEPSTQPSQPETGKSGSAGSESSMNPDQSGKGKSGSANHSPSVHHGSSEQAAQNGSAHGHEAAASMSPQTHALAHTGTLGLLAVLVALALVTSGVVIAYAARLGTRINR